MAATPADGSEAVADDELLYRRIPVSTGWHDPTTGDTSFRAFRPREDELTGISVYRAKYTSIERAATGRPGKQFFIAVFSAAAIRSCGLSVDAAPLPDEPGHAEIGGLGYEVRHLPAAVKRMEQLAQELCLRVEGPFPADET